LRGKERKMKKIIILTCFFAVSLFAQEKNEIIDTSEYARIFEQMKSMFATINYQEKKKFKDVYLSAKIYDNIGLPGYVNFGGNMEFGAISYRNNMMFSGEMCGGFYNWGAGFNLGFLAELPNEHLIISGISTGAWIAMNFYNDANRNNEDYYSQFMLGGPFAKYLIGKNKRFFEISARALMGWADKYYESSDSYGNRDSKTAFLINFNISVGLTVLF
jgi:hypothetical protein